jgi:hypothetical protein
MFNGSRPLSPITLTTGYRHSASGAFALLQLSHVLHASRSDLHMSLMNSPGLSDCSSGEFALVYQLNECMLRAHTHTRLNLCERDWLRDYRVAPHETEIMLLSECPACSGLPTIDSMSSHLTRHVLLLLRAPLTATLSQKLWFSP